MKKPAFVFVVALLSTITLFAQRPQQLPDKQKIIHVLQLQRQAWNRGDLNEYMQGYWQSDSLTFIGKSGVNKGWNLTLFNYQKAYPDKETMGTLKFDVLTVELLSKTTAHVIGKWTLTRTKKESTGGYFTLLFKKIDGRWLIVCDHTS